MKKIKRKQTKRKKKKKKKKKKKEKNKKRKIIKKPVVVATSHLMSTLASTKQENILPIKLIRIKNVCNKKCIFKCKSNLKHHNSA